MTRKFCIPYKISCTVIDIYCAKFKRGGTETSESERYNDSLQL